MYAFVNLINTLQFAEVIQNKAAAELLKNDHFLVLRNLMYFMNIITSHKTAVTK